MSIISKVLFAGFIFLLPIYYSFDTQQIFEVNKYWLLSMFTGMITIFGSTTLFYNKENVVNIFPRNFWIFSGIFFLSIFISSFFAQTPVTAFLGGTSRHQGAVFLLMMFLLFIGTQYFFSEISEKIKIKKLKKGHDIKTIQEKNIRNFLIYPLIFSALVSSWIALEQSSGNFLGIFSNAKVFDFHILAIQDISMRSFGAMGQPNFLAQFLLLPFFLSLYLVFSNKKNIVKALFFSGISGTIFYAIHTTESRAGEFVGLGIGFLILICFLGVHSSHFSSEKKQNIFWGIMSFLVFSGIIFVSYIFHNPEILTHLGERARSVLARMQFWKESIPLLTQNFSTFFFGIGGDQLSSAFQPIASVRLNELEGFSYSPDRTHTIFLDFILHYGVIAGIIFLGFLLRILWKTSQLIFNKNTEISQKLLLISIFSGLLATLGSWSVGFYVTTDASIFMIFLGILGVFISKNSPSSLFQNWQSKLVISSFLVILSLSFFYIANITKNSDRARYQYSLSSQNPEKILSPKKIQEYLENAPHLQENFLTLQTEESLEKAEQLGFHSFTFYYQKFISTQKKEDFEKAKISAGKHIPSHIALFKATLTYNTFSHQELVEYAKEVYAMVPNKYYTPANWMNPEIQKFWKHHQDFVIILDWVDK